MKMKKFTIYFLLIFSVLLVSCNKDDSNSVKIRDRQEVYDEDIVEIEEYLQNNYLDTNDFSVKSIENGESSIWSSLDDSGNPYRLQYITVKNDSRNSIYTDGDNDDPVDYKLYYILINEGGGMHPASVDSTYTAYKGWNLDNEVFDQNNVGFWSSFPETSVSAVSGFRQVLSLINAEPTGSSTVNPDGTVNHFDFGHVIVFIPSGLAYFNQVNVGIGQYAPIMFEIKLFSVVRRDHDADGILSIYEDLNGDNNFFNDDTDGDKIPDFFDQDDDNDYKRTKFEIEFEYDDNGEIKTARYPFEGAAVDDPLTPYDDRLGVPDCSGDFTTPTRLRKYLDPNCN